MASVEFTSGTPRQKKPLTSFIPPDTLPIDISNPITREVFRSAVTGNLDSDLKNNAPLDANTITTLADGIISHDPEIVYTGFSANSCFFSADYKLKSDLKPACFVHVRITSCKDATTAQEMMVSYLNTSQNDIRTSTKKPERQLGQVALQSGTKMYWVRDALWVQVIPEYKNEDYKEMVEQEPARKRRRLRSSRSVTELVTTMVLDFATRLDAHLARSAVPPSEQWKPETAVNTVSCKAASGKSFSVRLLDASNTLKIYEAEVKDRSVVIQSGISDPAAVGEYEFFADQPGKTTVTLIVVRADNFALGTTEVQVEVTGRRWDDERYIAELEAKLEADLEAAMGVKMSMTEFLVRAKQQADAAHAKAKAAQAEAAQA